MGASFLTSASLFTLFLLAPSIAMADQPVRSEASISFPESDRNAARREAQRSENRQQTRQKPRPRSGPPVRPESRPVPERSRQPRISGGDRPIIGYTPEIPYEGGNNRNGRNRDRDRDHDRRGRNRDRDHDRDSRGRNWNQRDHYRNDRHRYRNGYRDGRRSAWRDSRRHDRRHFRNRHNHSNVGITFSFGTTGYHNYSSGYGFGYGRNFGQRGHYSFLGGNFFQSGYNLYPWWYGDDFWGYRTHTGFRHGYGHIGHSNVYCTDPFHQAYGVYWNQSRRNSQHFTLHSNFTNGSFGGHQINSCHLENRRGHFGRRQAVIRMTMCWDGSSQRYVETGAVQLINYY